MRNRGVWAAGTGALSLLLIFAVLCLGIFAALTLSTAKTELTLAERCAENSRQFYAADLSARAVCDEIEALLGKGEGIPPKIGDTAIASLGTADEIDIAFAIPCGTGALAVRLEYAGGELDVTRWSLLQAEGWAAYDDLNVWTDD